MKYDGASNSIFCKFYTASSYVWQFSNVFRTNHGIFIDVLFPIIYSIFSNKLVFVPLASIDKEKEFYLIPVVNPTRPAIMEAL